MPAVGFSIGFERIFSVLSDRGTVTGSRKKAAVLYNEGSFAAAYTYAKTLHSEYDVTLVIAKKKIGKQFGQLEQQGFDAAVVFDNDKEWKALGNKE